MHVFVIYRDENSQQKKTLKVLKKTSSVLNMNMNKYILKNKTLKSNISLKILIPELNFMLDIICF